jgi:hypothetical protein
MFEWNEDAEQCGNQMLTNKALQYLFILNPRSEN